jgi:hypothetical protein
MTQDQKISTEKPKKRKGCFFWGCMTTLGIIVIAAIVLSFIIFNVPQKIGLVKPAAEKILSQTPDRETAAKIKSDLQAAGINTTGVDVYVFPEKNTDNKNILYTVLDSSKGFTFSNYGSQDAISGYLVQLAKNIPASSINRVAFEYRDYEGKSVAQITAPTDVILKYSNGQISREQFFKAIDAKMNFSEYMKSGTP